MKLRDTIVIALLFTTGLAAQRSITETKDNTQSREAEASP